MDKTNIKDIISKYDVTISYDENDNDYVASVNGYDRISCIVGIGDTREEALKELNIALECALEIIIEEGWSLPKPTKTTINV